MEKKCCIIKNSEIKNDIQIEVGNQQVSELKVCISFATVPDNYKLFQKKLKYTSKYL